MVGLVEDDLLLCVKPAELRGPPVTLLCWGAKQKSESELPLLRCGLAIGLPDPGRHARH